jgi:hypothetical protein
VVVVILADVSQEPRVSDGHPLKGLKEREGKGRGTGLFSRNMD